MDSTKDVQLSGTEISTVNETKKDEARTSGEKIGRFIKDTSVTLLIITSLSAYFVYLFKQGYMEYYGFSKQLVSIGIGDFVELFTAFITIILTWLIIENGIADLYLNKLVEDYRKDNNSTKAIRRIVGFWVVSIEVLLLSIASEFQNKDVCIVAGIIGVIGIIIVIVEGRKIDLESTNKGHESSPSDELKKRILLAPTILGQRVLTIIVIIFIFSPCALSLGKSYAKKQEVFYQVDQREDVVGVVLVDNVLLAKKADFDGYIMLPIDGDTEILEVGKDFFNRVISPIVPECNEVPVLAEEVLDSTDQVM